jgi:hypothetical protein
MDKRQETTELKAKRPAEAKSGPDVADTQRINGYFKPGVRLSSALERRDGRVTGACLSPLAVVDLLGDESPAPPVEKILDIVS